MSNVINTSECENCIHSTIIEESRSRIYVLCAARDKKYYYGQCVPCDDMKKKG